MLLGFSRAVSSGKKQGIYNLILQKCYLTFALRVRRSRMTADAVFVLFKIRAISESWNLMPGRHLS